MTAYSRIKCNSNFMKHFENISELKTWAAVMLILTTYFKVIDIDETICFKNNYLNITSFFLYGDEKATNDQSILLRIFILNFDTQRFIAYLFILIWQQMVPEYIISDWEHTIWSSNQYRWTKLEENIIGREIKESQEMWG